jgi:hypothetical protein
MGNVNDISVLAKHAKAIRVRGKRVVDDIIEVGRRLSECKVIAGHGNWLAWLDREFGWDDRTAERFMGVYRLSGKSDNLSNLDIPVSAMYLLAAPSTPEKAREKIIERAEAGEKITTEEAKKIVAGHKPAPQGEPANRIQSSAPADADKGKPVMAPSAPASKPAEGQQPSTGQPQADEHQRLIEQVAKLKAERRDLVVKLNAAMNDPDSIAEALGAMPLDQVNTVMTRLVTDFMPADPRKRQEWSKIACTWIQNIYGKLAGPREAPWK